MQAGDKDFEHNKDKLPGSFPIVLELEGAFLYTCPVSHHFMSYHDNGNERLPKARGMEEVVIPTDLVFAGHGLVEHAGGEWLGKYCLQYHISQIWKQWR